jgi:addiction module HigA family antidote
MIERDMIYTDLTKNSLTGNEFSHHPPFPCIGNEVEYRGLTLQEFATRIGLTESDLIDVLDDKRSYWPVAVAKEGSIPDNMMPYAPTHPGDMLKEEIEYRELNLTELAGQMGITERELIEILDEKRPVTEDYARRFEAADIGFTAEWLRNMQSGYDIECVLIPMRNLRRLEKENLRKQQQPSLPLHEWHRFRRQSIPTKQRVAVRTPATVGRQRVPA